jgi:hypothetical protein
MDYAQEQADEIEALESIYADVFEKLTDKPPWKVTLTYHQSSCLSVFVCMHNLHH